MFFRNGAAALVLCLMLACTTNVTPQSGNNEPTNSTDGTADGENKPSSGGGGGGRGGGGDSGGTQCNHSCDEGTSQCQGHGVRTCQVQPDGCRAWSSVLACKANEECPSGGSACVAAACKAGERRCRDTAVESCSPARTWQTDKLCPQQCTLGQCTDAVTCTPGAIRCNGSNVDICNSSGTAWLYKQTCQGSCSAGVCLDSCSAGAKRCRGNGPEICQGAAGWVAAPACQTACFEGACIEADLVVDGVKVTLEGEQRFHHSIVVRNGGQIVVGPSGNLNLQAKRVSIDGASSIVANAVGDERRAAAGDVNGCCLTCGTSVCRSVPVGASYGSDGASGDTWKSNYCCSTCTNGCNVTWASRTYDRNDDLSLSEGSVGTSGKGGGLLRIIAEQVDVSGAIQANAASNGSGGGILIAADRLTGNSAIQAVGGSAHTPAGGMGRVKLLTGSVASYSGPVTGAVVRSVMPPLDIVSGTHPDPERYYNDLSGDVVVAWSKPFPTVNGYYYVASDKQTGVPSPTQGKFLQAETFTVPSSSLVAGDNFFHIVSVDASFNVGTVKNTFRTRINTLPPTVTSSSHPNQTQWYANNAAYLTWKNPHDDANFTGYYYVLDKRADTVPTAQTGTFTTSKQLLLSNLADGIWVFHLVNRDTRGFTTKAAQHFVMRIGAEPKKGNIAGSAFDASNNSVSLSGVELLVNGGLLTVATGSAGTYTFNNATYEGTWDVTARKPGYATQTKSVTVIAGQTATLNFNLVKE